MVHTMTVMQITSREFRANQKAFFELADNGTRIIINRGKGKSYALTPIEDPVLQLTPEAERQIKKGLEEIRNRETVKFTDEVSMQLFGEVL